MLDALRKHASGLVAKIFMGLLVLSFAVWGVADIFRGYRSNAVITVGDVEISADEFRFAYQTELQRAARQLGRTLSQDEARALQIDSRVVGRLVTEATLDNDARNRKLGIPTEEVARSIAEDPAFKDNYGRFNKDYFDQVLRANGLSEAAYVAQERRLHLRQQLSNTVTLGATAPTTLVEALHRYREERRTIAYVVVAASAPDAIPAPDEAALASYFEENRARFRLPEFRKFEIIDVSAASLILEIEVAEEDIAASYEARKDSFNTPERREIQQIVFQSEEEAKAAAEKIAAGTDFLEVAKERGLGERDVSLGLMDKAAVSDAAIRDAAFALAEGAVSEPVKGQLGTVLLRVTRIEPPATKTLADVRDEIRGELARKKVQETAFDIYDKVEDERASGAPFAEIAKKLGLDYRVVEAMDANGRDPEGKAIADLPVAQNLINLVAENDPGVEMDAVQTGDGGFVWVNVLDVLPERDRTLDEARAEVEKGWREEEARRLVGERANVLLERAKAGETLDALSSELGSPLITTQPLQRSASDEVLSQAAIQSAFAQPVESFAVSQHSNGRDRILMRIVKSEVPAFDAKSDDGAKLVEAVRNSVSTSLLSQYVGARQESFGVQINQQTLQALLGNR